MAKDKSPIKLREKLLKNGNKSLYLDVYVNGRRSYETLQLYIIPEKTPIDKQRNKATYQQAETHRARRILELQSHKYGTVDSKLTNSKVTLLQAITMKMETCDGSSYKGYVTLKNQIEALGDIRLENITLSYIRKYLNSLKVAEITKKIYLTRLSSVLSLAVRKEFINKNVILNLEKGERPSPEERVLSYLTLDEIKKLINTKCGNNEVKRAFLFACFIGLRWCDIVNLRYCHITKLKDKYQIARTQKKTKRTVYIPVSQNAEKYLTKNGTVDITKNPTHKIFNLPSHRAATGDIDRWVKRAGINKNVTFHTSRHTYATLLLTYDADIYTVSKLLGHKSIKTTQIYAEVIDKKKEKAVDNVPNI